MAFANSVGELATITCRIYGVDSSGRCDPWAPVTRAQAVRMLYNIGITRAGQLTPTNWSELAGSSGPGIG